MNPNEDIIKQYKRKEFLSYKVLRRSQSLFLVKTGIVCLSSCLYQVLYIHLHVYLVTSPNLQQVCEAWRREGSSDAIFFFFFLPLDEWLYAIFKLKLVLKKYNLLSSGRGCIVRCHCCEGDWLWHQAKSIVGVETSRIIKYHSTLLSCHLINWCALKTTLGRQNNLSS